MCIYLYSELTRVLAYKVRRMQCCGVRSCLLMPICAAFVIAALISAVSVLPFSRDPCVMFRLHGLTRLRCTLPATVEEGTDSKYGTKCALQAAPVKPRQLID